MNIHSFHLFPWTDIPDRQAAQWPFPDVDYDDERAAEFYEDYLEQIEFCDEMGLDGVVFNEHHYSAYAMDPAPIVLASHVAALTDQVSLGFMGNVLPVRGNPLRVAEELALLDTVTRGRVIAGFARGIPIEYLAYNVDMGESREMFKEAVGLILEAWTAEEPFDWDGDFWEYEGVNIWPKPYQDPHPDLWMPATSEPSIRFAVENRMAHGQTGNPEEAGQRFDVYRRLAEEEYGWTPDEDQFVLGKSVFVGESTEGARETIREHMEFHWDYLFGGVHRGGVARQMGDDRYEAEKHYASLSEHAKDAIDFDFDEAVETGAVVVGDADYVAAELERQYEEVGFGNLLCTFHHGSAPHETTMASMERFADDVLPELRKLG